MICSMHSQICETWVLIVCDFQHGLPSTLAIYGASDKDPKELDPLQSLIWNGKDRPNLYKYGSFIAALLLVRVFEQI